MHPEDHPENSPCQSQNPGTTDCKIGSLTENKLEVGKWKFIFNSCSANNDEADCNYFPNISS